jgi:AcrR family transcriptional regulator
VTARRTEILDAALASFIARGVDGMTIADIRARARATTGSVYHFFASKDAIVGALYLELLREYHDDLNEHLRRHTTARGLVRGFVERYLAWVERRPDAARYLLEARRTKAIATVEEEITAVTASRLRAVAALMRPWIEAGELQRLRADVYLPIMVGPAEVYARTWLAGAARTPIGRARTLLADAAWNALRARA